MNRQHILSTWPSPTFSFVLDESVLLRPVGGRSVHQEQLDSLLHIGSLRTVELQVMPLTRTEQPVIDGPFTLLTDKKNQRIAYTDTLGHPRLITDADKVNVFDERYGLVRVQALTPSESLGLIDGIRAEL